MGVVEIQQAGPTPYGLHTSRELTEVALRFHGPPPAMTGGGVAPELDAAADTTLL